MVIMKNLQGSIARLPIRYNDKDGNGYCDALIPSQCHYHADPKGVFQCTSGETVEVQWLSIQHKDKSKELLDRICQELYGWQFEQVQSQWYTRVDDLDGYWSKIRMKRV